MEWYDEMKLLKGIASVELISLPKWAFQKTKYKISIHGRFIVVESKIVIPIIFIWNQIRRIEGDNIYIYLN